VNLSSRNLAMRVNAQRASYLFADGMPGKAAATRH
jgi:hypothetical protein